MHRARRLAYWAGRGWVACGWCVPPWVGGPALAPTWLPSPASHASLACGVWAGRGQVWGAICGLHTRNCTPNTPPSRHPAVPHPLDWHTGQDALPTHQPQGPWPPIPACCEATVPVTCRWGGSISGPVLGVLWCNLCHGVCALPPPPTPSQRLYSPQPPPATPLQPSLPCSREWGVAGGGPQVQAWPGQGRAGGGRHPPPPLGPHTDPPSQGAGGGGLAQSHSLPNPAWPTLNM